MRMLVVRVWGMCWICLVLLCGAFIAPASALAQDGPSRHGQTLVGSYELPAVLLDQYNEAIHSQPVAVTSALAQIRGWTGAEFRVSSSGNPYTLVVKMLGQAVDTDDMAARWQPYWSDLPGSMAAMGEPSARAGEPLQLVLASEPVTLEAGRLVTPSLRLLAARNVRMDRVRLEVWSGAGETSVLEWLADWWLAAATLVIWGGLIVYLHRERRRAALAGPPAEALVEE